MGVRVNFFFALSGSIPWPWGCCEGDGSTQSLGPRAAQAAACGGVLAGQGGCVWGGAPGAGWLRVRGCSWGRSTASFALAGDGEGREGGKAPRFGCGVCVCKIIGG